MHLPNFLRRTLIVVAMLLVCRSGRTEAAPSLRLLEDLFVEILLRRSAETIGGEITSRQLVAAKTQFRELAIRKLTGKRPHFYKFEDFQRLRRSGDLGDPIRDITAYRDVRESLLDAIRDTSAYHDAHGSLLDAIGHTQAPDTWATSIDELLSDRDIVFAYANEYTKTITQAESVFVKGLQPAQPAQPARPVQPAQPPQHVEDILARATSGSDDTAQFGEEVFAMTSGRLEVVNSRTRSLIPITPEEANLHLDKMLRKHVHGAQDGAQYFTVSFVEGNLKFILNDTVVPVSRTPEAVTALTDVLLRETTRGQDIIFTMDPRLPSESRALIDELMFSLTKQVAERDGRLLYVDDYRKTTRPRAAKIRNTPASTPMAALVAAPFFKVVDGKVIQNIDDELSVAGMKIVQVGPDGRVAPPDESVVVVITGHSAPEFAQFVDTLVQRGVFQGKTVVMNSCGSWLTRELASTIIRRGGAIGIWRFYDVIDSNQLRTFMRALGHERQIPRAKLPDILKNSTRKAGLHGQMQISLLQGAVDVG